MKLLNDGIKTIVIEKIVIVFVILAENWFFEMIERILSENNNNNMMENYKIKLSN